MANDSVITQQKLKEYHETYVYPFLNGISTKGDQAFVPCGKIEGFMRTTAPKGYLVCDGTEYLKSAYPSLAALLASVDTAQSTTNFAGSDSDHFKVPDLRGEFLRGTGTNSHANQGNGASVGSHQDATESPNIKVWVNAQNNGGNLQNFGANETIEVKNVDKFLGNSGFHGYTDTALISSSASTQAYYSSRPTNTSVLYCIAYQDLYLTPGHTYSTNEQVVGTWIDGKVLYEKTIFLNTKVVATANAWTTVITDAFVASIETLTSFEICRMNETPRIDLPISLRVGSSNNLEVYSDVGFVHISALTVRYTKVN